MKPTKILLLLLAYFALGSSCLAQGWQKTYDLGGNPEYAYGVVATTGGYVIGGITTAAGSTARNPFVYKIDEQGQVVWTRHFNPSSNFRPENIVKTSSGDFLIYGKADVPNSSQMFVAKVSATGDSLWFKVYGQNGFYTDAKSLVETSNGDILVGISRFDSVVSTGNGEAFWRLSAAGDSLDLKIMPPTAENVTIYKMINTRDHNILLVGQQGSHVEPYMAKLNEMGDTIWTKHFEASDRYEYPWDVVETRDSGFAIGGLDIYYTTTTPPGTQKEQAFVFKVDKNGDSLWHAQISDSVYAAYAQSLVEDTGGNLALAGNLQNSPTTATRWAPLLTILDANGHEIKRKAYWGLPCGYASIIGISRTSTGGFIMVGAGGYNYLGDDIYVMKTDGLGNVYPAHIAGTLYYDSIRNCTINSGEKGLQYWVIKASNGATDYYGLSDNHGNYTIDCNLGTYTLNPIDLSGYWAADSTCTDSLMVTVLANMDTAYRNIAMSPRIATPMMQVHVSAAFLRQCLQGPAYSINYSNLGTIPASGVYTDVSLAADLILDSSSIAYTALGSNVYRFNLGTVGIFDHGSFLMYVRTSCASTVHTTHCVSAHIYPDTIGLPPSALWDHSHLDIQSTCHADSLEFRVTNGGSDMSSSVQYSIIQDDILFAHGTIKLNSLQSLTTRVPSNGSTWTFITSQTVGHPGKSRPLLSVEGCGTNGQGGFSTGYVAMYPQNDQDPFYDVLCLEDITSHDPNAKTAEPKGLDAPGYIDASQPITYTLSFQNTGTDTAFTVAVVDTISPLLDLSTLRVVGSSHPYSWKINNGNVLEFDFDSIVLPDSSVNEIASNGFITFIISPKAGLVAGTEIKNTGYIYFDANPPVATNVTLNTIGDQLKTWLAVDEIADQNNHLDCYPNPTSGILVLDYKGTNDGALFTVYDVLGKIVLERKVMPGIQQLNIGNLNNGIYLYQLTGKGENANGKITKF